MPVLAAALTLSCTAEPQVPVGARALRDLSYVTNGHQRQKLDLYLPEKPQFVFSFHQTTCIHTYRVLKWFAVEKPRWHYP